MRLKPLLLTIPLTFLAFMSAQFQGDTTSLIYLPLLMQGNNKTLPEPEMMQEFRGLWVTRFEWTNGSVPASPTKIDEIVDNAALAGFNAIFFQVRGTADAYYTPGLEPWAQRVSGNNLGDPPNPYWDPLAYFIEKAHAQNIELHAYLNVYPLSNCLGEPDASVTPRPLYHLLQDQYGTSMVADDEGPVEMNNGLMWIRNNTSKCVGHYYRASPASLYTDNHLVAIGKDLVERYEIDGLHLDHIRYGGSTTSCDPVSLCRYHTGEEQCDLTNISCDITQDYQNWQRRQVNGTVRRFYEDIVINNPDVWLSAAVWPIHTDKWGWGGLEGYHDYYQDSKAWVQGHYIDSISPMIYSNPSGECVNDGDNFWTRARWEALVTDFQAENGGRFVFPGIGTKYCNFEDIAWRIQRGREIGVPGHALFSYSYLKQQSFFDDFASGPYAEPARVPDGSWK